MVRIRTRDVQLQSLVRTGAMKIIKIKGIIRISENRVWNIKSARTMIGIM